MVQNYLLSFLNFQAIKLINPFLCYKYIFETKELKNNQKSNKTPNSNRRGITEEELHTPFVFSSYAETTTGTNDAEYSENTVKIIGQLFSTYPLLSDIMLVMYNID